MKSFYRRLNNILLIFFVLGIIFLIYQLYTFTASVESLSPLITPDVTDAMSPAVWRLSFVVIITLILGLVCIVISMYLLNFTKENEKIVYVEKSAHQKKEEAKQENEIKIDQNALREIEKAISEKRTLKTKCDVMLSALCDKIEASQGILYVASKSGKSRHIEMFSSYAFSLADSEGLKYEFGEGLAGQAAKEGKVLNVDDIPEGYINILSGLGTSSPNNLLIHPIKINNEVEAVVELASFKKFRKEETALVEKTVLLVQNEFEKEKSTKKAEAKSTKSVSVKKDDTKSAKEKNVKKK